MPAVSVDTSTNTASYAGLTVAADGSYSFDASSLISIGEQGAVAQLASALSTALEQDAEMAGFAASFVAGLVGAEAGIAAAAGGASVAAAVAAGEAAGQAAAATVGASLTSGPGAALLVLALAIVALEGGDAFAFLDGFDPFGGGHESCCGDAPDPTPQTYVQSGSIRLVVAPGLSVSGAQTETKQQAIQRATQYAYGKNADSSCAGNHSLLGFVGPMLGMPIDSIILPIVPGDDPRLAQFTQAANQLLYRYIDQAGMTKCWPLAQRASAGHLLAMTLSAWNAAHFGPAVTLTRTIYGGSGPYADLVGLALDWGALEWQTKDGQGYLGTVLPKTPATVKLAVNVGPLIPSSLHIAPIKVAPPTPTPLRVGPLHAQPSVHAPAPAPATFALEWAMIGGVIGTGIAGPIGAAFGAGVGAAIGRLVRVPPPPPAAA